MPYDSRLVGSAMFAFSRLRLVVFHWYVSRFVLSTIFTEISPIKSEGWPSPLLRTDRDSERDTGRKRQRQ